MKKDSKQMLFEMMGKIDPTFKPKMNEDFGGSGDDERRRKSDLENAKRYGLFPHIYRDVKEFVKYSVFGDPAWTDMLMADVNETSEILTNRYLADNTSYNKYRNEIQKLIRFQLKIFQHGKPSEY